MRYAEITQDGTYDVANHLIDLKVTTQSAVALNPPNLTKQEK